MKRRGSEEEEEEGQGKWRRRRNSHPCRQGMKWEFTLLSAERLHFPPTKLLLRPLRTILILQKQKQAHWDPSSHLPKVMECQSQNLNPLFPASRA